MSEPAPRVSVIIPVFNCERYLDEALDSVMAQRIDSLETIVVDDGSTDDSAGVARRRGARVIESAHGGVARARNLGLAAARGELIAWLDADDVWTEGSLRTRIEYLDAHPEVDFVYGSMEPYDDADRPPPDWLAPTQNPDPVGWLPVFLIRRPACDQTGEFDESMIVAEDFDWISRLKDAGAHGVRLDAVLVRHRLRSDSTTIVNVAVAVPAMQLAVRRAIARKRRESSP
jgi:glycosyltransferase involved in cell wall biosynthesis